MKANVSDTKVLHRGGSYQRLNVELWLDMKRFLLKNSVAGRVEKFLSLIASFSLFHATSYADLFNFRMLFWA